MQSAAAPPYLSSPSIGQWSVPLRSARAQCFRSWWRRPCSGFSSSVVTQPDAADGVWPSARQRERAGRPLTGSSTTPSPSSRPATSATYVFRTAPGVANAVASRAHAACVRAYTRSPPVPLSSRCTNCGCESASGRSAGGGSAAATARRSAALRRLPSSVTSPCTATPAGFTSTATQSSTCAHSSARSGSGVASRAARCSRGRITYSTVWPATAASATAAAAPSTTMSCRRIACFAVFRLGNSVGSAICSSSSSGRPFCVAVTVKRAATQSVAWSSGSEESLRRRRRRATMRTATAAAAARATLVVVRIAISRAAKRARATTTTTTTTTTTGRCPVECCEERAV